MLAALAPLPKGIRRFNDERTGREVWQITSDGGFNHCAYFEAQPFTHDDRYVVYASRRSGEMQLYRADLATGEHAQITHGQDVRSMSYSVYPDGRTVIYQEGTRLVRVEASTGQVTWALDMASLRIPGAERFTAGRTYSSDGRYTAVAYAGEREGVALLDLGHGKRLDLGEGRRLSDGSAEAKLAAAVAPGGRLVGLVSVSNGRTRVVTNFPHVGAGSSRAGGQ